MNEQNNGIAERRMDQQYYRLLEEIQTVDFMLVELNLYLNTHPYDYQTIKQYNDCAKQSMTLKQGFQSRYGPLTNFGQSFSGYPWQWDDAPWPWQV